MCLQLLLNSENHFYKLKIMTYDRVALKKSDSSPHLLSYNYGYTSNKYVQYLSHVHSTKVDSFPIGSIIQPSTWA